MKPSWAVLRIEGTNSEDESAACLRHVGAEAEIIHLKQLTGDDVSADERRRLSDYDGLWVAGGFSAGDSIRAGAIAARMKSRLGADLLEFVKDEKPVLGICNGFQILVELGLLPDMDGVGMTEAPTAALHLNDSGHYECRPSLLKHVNKGTCRYTRTIPEGDVRTITSSHAEGKFLMADEAAYQRLLDQDQVVFTYTDPDGSDAPAYPWTPNGAAHAIAGVCNPAGNVFGMMPHPERVFFRRNHHDWTRTGLDVGLGHDVGDGRAILESIVATQVA
ncbi:MAG: phosphoribosylformylglycinamidine synthase I [Thermoplasmatota archaeon]